MNIQYRKTLLSLALIAGLQGCGGSSSTVTTTSSTTGSNTAPVASAGVDQNVTPGITVSLNASGSSDADGNSLTYYWSAVTVPANSAAVLDSMTTVNPTFTADVAGSYTFQVAVSDGTETTTDQVVITATTTSTAAGQASTAGIACDYSYSGFNASSSVNATSTSAWTCTGTTRELTANGIPDHAVGTFPNPGNPNTISEQTVTASYTLTPTKTDVATTRGGPAGPEGHVLNGIKIDASTGGSCTDYGTSCSGGDNGGAWNLEALGHSSFDFGADENNAHVQPDGTYHYHGMPEGFITLRGGNSSKMTQIGWAADGFPIYARYGYSDPTNASSAIKKVSGSYQLVTSVSETRPSVDIYSLGTFKQDWQYVAGSGDLDECNGRFGVTPEFPNGIYHYYATDSYPYFQRCVKGAVASAGGPPAGGAPTGAPPADAPAQ
jgi:hypothetical protein